MDTAIRKGRGVRLSGTTDEIAAADQLHFDYTNLDAETRIVVQQQTREIRERVRRAATDILEIGERLIDVRARLDEGGFAAWLRAEFDWSRAAAYRFIAVAEQFGGQASQIETFAPSALYLLAAPSTPAEARAEATRRADAGERVTHQAARQIVERHRPKPVRTVTDETPDPLPPDFATVMRRLERHGYILEVKRAAAGLVYTAGANTYLTWFDVVRTADVLDGATATRPELAGRSTAAQASAVPPVVPTEPASTAGIVLTADPTPVPFDDWRAAVVGLWTNLEDAWESADRPALVTACRTMVAALSAPQDAPTAPEVAVEPTVAQIVAARIARVRQRLGAGRREGNEADVLAKARQVIEQELVEALDDAAYDALTAALAAAEAQLAAVLEEVS